MYKNTQTWYLSTPPNLESCLSSSKVIGFTQKKISKTKTVVAQKSDPWFNHQTTFIFKTRIQYKRDQIF